MLEFVERAFGYLNLDWREYVAEDPRYLRRQRAHSCWLIPWRPSDGSGGSPVTVRDLVRIMMAADLEAAGLPAPGKGKQCLLDGRLSWLRRP